MKPAKVELDREGIAAALSAAEPVAALRRRAQATVTEAKATGPRGAHLGRHEVDRIAVGDVTITPTGPQQAILWDSSFWHLIEFGSANNPPYRVLTRAAQNQGLRVIDEGRR